MPLLFLVVRDWSVSGTQQENEGGWKPKGTLHTLEAFSRVKSFARARLGPFRASNPHCLVIGKAKLFHLEQKLTLLLDTFTGTMDSGQKRHLKFSNPNKIYL